MNRWLLFSMLLMLVVGCQAPEARRPVQQRSGSLVDLSAERNKALYQQEILDLENLIAEDTLNTYYPTEQGFWYYYNRRDTILGPTPQTGDQVRFRYGISDLAGNEIVTADENGWIDYRVDQSNQELISGLRQGIKFMKAGEEVTFLFPSYFAFGYYGLQGRVGRNQPIYCTVELESIISNNPNNSKIDP